jgi:hypothetical protein
LFTESVALRPEPLVGARLAWQLPQPQCDREMGNPTMNGSAFQYVGYVESINIKGAGQHSHQFLFSAINPKGDKHWSFLLDPTSEPLRYTAMASLLTAAFAGDKMVRLNTTSNGPGPAFASEIEVVRGDK